MPVAADPNAGPQNMTEFLARRASAQVIPMIRSFPTGTPQSNQLKSEIATILTACGDVTDPLDGTLDTVASLLTTYMSALVTEALNDAARHPAPGAHAFEGKNIVNALQSTSAVDPFPATHTSKVVKSAVALREMLQVPVAKGQEAASAASGGYSQISQTGATKAAMLRAACSQKDELVNRALRGEFPRIAPPAPVIQHQQHQQQMMQMMMLQQMQMHQQQQQAAQAAAMNAAASAMRGPMMPGPMGMVGGQPRPALNIPAVASQMALAPPTMTIPASSPLPPPRVPQQPLAVPQLPAYMPAVPQPPRAQAAPPAPAPVPAPAPAPAPTVQARRTEQDDEEFML